MKKFKINITLINTISNILLQMVTLISGFIIPKIILKYFGSEVNGLVSSITQFLNYISILEGGITGVVMANLYKPLTEKNQKKISSIINASNKFYKKISLIFILYSLLLAIAYPILFSSNFSYIYVFSLTIILSISSFIQYCFSLTLKTLLNADKKIYIVAFSQTLIIIINIILSIVSIKIFPSIHFFKFLTAVTYLLQPLIYSYYGRKYYVIDSRIEADSNLLKSRWDGFAINIAAFIHYSTDVVILTIFTDLATVSVYNIFSLVTNGLRNLILSVSSSISPTIGHAYARNDKNELNLKFDLYEYILTFLVFLLFTVGALLINPFVQYYVKNINDANYNQPLFSIILIFSEAIYLIKSPHVNLAYSANMFKKLTIPSYAEAIINIVLSLILVNVYGLIGVAIGTLVAMVLSMIYQVKFTKKIMDRKMFVFYKKIILFLFSTVIGIIICKIFIPKISISLFNIVLHGIIYMVLFFIIYLLMSLVFYKRELRFIKSILNIRRKYEKNISI